MGGWNIATHLREAREELGLCPQHNMLFVDLTVMQHLLFFGRVGAGRAGQERMKSIHQHERGDRLPPPLQRSDPFFPFLSSQLKGLTTRAAREEAKALLERLELMDKRNMFGNQLSGGMKRKLSLAIALIGGSKARTVKALKNYRAADIQCLGAKE